MDELTLTQLFMNSRTSLLLYQLSSVIPQRPRPAGPLQFYPRYNVVAAVFTAKHEYFELSDTVVDVHSSR